MAKTTLRKKSGAGGTTSLLSDYPTKLQYGTGTKTDTQINGTEVYKLDRKTDITVTAREQSGLA